jgi:hypothetical protein
MTDPEREELALTFMKNVEVQELRDHYFGDREITLFINEEEIGDAYLSRSHKGMAFTDSHLIPAELRGWKTGDYKLILRLLAAASRRRSERNDSEGDDTYMGA